LKIHKLYILKKWRKGVLGTDREVRKEEEPFILEFRLLLSFVL